MNWKDQIKLDQGLDECIFWVKENLESLKKESFDYQHKS